MNHILILTTTERDKQTSNKSIRRWLTIVAYTDNNDLILSNVCLDTNPLVLGPISKLMLLWTITDEPALATNVAIRDLEWSLLSPFIKRGLSIRGNTAITTFAPFGRHRLFWFINTTSATISIHISRCDQMSKAYIAVNPVAHLLSPKLSSSSFTIHQR